MSAFIEINQVDGEPKFVIQNVTMRRTSEDVLLRRLRYRSFMATLGFLGWAGAASSAFVVCSVAVLCAVEAWHLIKVLGE